MSDQNNLLKIIEINIKRGVIKEKGKREGLRPLEVRGWRNALRGWRKGEGRWTRDEGRKEVEKSRS